MLLSDSVYNKRLVFKAEIDQTAMCRSVSSHRPVSRPIIARPSSPLPWLFLYIYKINHFSLSSMINAISLRTKKTIVSSVSIYAWRAPRPWPCLPLACSSPTCSTALPRTLSLAACWSHWEISGISRGRVCV